MSFDPSVVFQIMGVFAEFERAMIRERVLSGLERAKGWAATQRWRRRTTAGRCGGPGGCCATGKCSRIVDVDAPDLIARGLARLADSHRAESDRAPGGELGRGVLQAIEVDDVSAKSGVRESGIDRPPRERDDRFARRR